MIYDTFYGNTKKIGETAAETLKKSGLDVDFFYVKDVKESRGGDDFLVNLCLFSLRDLKVPYMRYSLV